MEVFVAQTFLGAVRIKADATTATINQFIDWSSSSCAEQHD
jgi:hypothetical protein